MLLGVTLVNKTRVGSKEKARDIVSEMRLEKTTKCKSGIPRMVMFILRTSISVVKHPITEHN